MDATQSPETTATQQDAKEVDEVSVTQSRHEFTAAPYAPRSLTACLQSSSLGLRSEEALELLKLHGPNTLPSSKTPVLAVTTGVWAVGASVISLMVCTTVALDWQSWLFALPMLGFALGQASGRYACSPQSANEAIDPLAWPDKQLSQVV